MKYLAIPLVLGSASCNPVPEAAPAPRIANPASEHCIERGGTLEIRDEANGQIGYCHLPDGRIVEEWQLFRESRPSTS